jgi:putative sigma-54 modulation protein
MALPEVRISGHNMKVTSKLKKYILEKLYKHERIFDMATLIEVECEQHASARGVDKDYRFMISLSLPKTRARVEKLGPDMTSLVDEATDVLSRNVNKYREKLQWDGKKHKDYDVEPKSLIPDESEDEISIVDYVPVIKERQTLENCAPMTEEEAIELMELQDRDCYLFKNKKSKEYAMVYRTRSGEYGIVEPC